MDAFNNALVEMFGVLESAHFTFEDRCITEAPESITPPTATCLTGYPFPSTITTENCTKILFSKRMLCESFECAGQHSDSLGGSTDHIKVL